jgi:hypothetical protein
MELRRRHKLMMADCTKQSALVRNDRDFWRIRAHRRNGRGERVRVDAAFKENLRRRHVSQRLLHIFVQSLNARAAYHKMRS